MASIPGAVKTVAAVCAFLSVSYAVSVWAAPRPGTDDLGAGGSEAVAGAYGRDPVPGRLRSPGPSQMIEAGVVGVGPGAGNRVAAPPVTPVSARTGVTEAVPPIATPAGEPATAGAAPAAPAAGLPITLAPGPLGGNPPSATGAGATSGASAGGRHPAKASAHGSGGGHCGSRGRPARAGGDRVKRPPTPARAAHGKQVGQPHGRRR